MKYVTYDGSGALTGAYMQALHAAHQSSFIEATDAQYSNWTAYKVNAERTGLELLPVADPLPIIRAKQWEQIKSLRDTKVQSGGYTVAGKWYHSDTFSRTQQMGLLMMGAGIPAVQWKTMDGTFVTMTQTLAGQIFAAAAAQDQANFLLAETLRAQVNAATDPATVDITAGWPATYS